MTAESSGSQMPEVKDEHWTTNGAMNVPRAPVAASADLASSKSAPSTGPAKSSGQCAVTPSTKLAPSFPLGPSQMPQMYPGFPPGLFNAAFAAAAAAAFPGLGGTNGGSNPLGVLPVVTPGSPCLPQVNFTRNRAERGAEGEANTKSDATGATSDVGGGNVQQGALPATKVETSEATVDAPAGGTGRTTAVATPTFKASPWSQPMNVITPGMLGGEISNQERKVWFCSDYILRN